jgi:hypothetical protein
MSDQTDHNKAKGFRLFAGFFKSYMGVMPIATAAFAPVLTLVKAFPIFDGQRTELASYLGLLSFLLLAWVFFSRHLLGGLMMKSRQVDAIMSTIVLLIICLSVASFIRYNGVLNDAVTHLQQTSAAGLKIEYILANAPVNEIPFAGTLILCYMSMFISAELAFVVMALKEYQLEQKKADQRSNDLGIG